MKTTSRFAIAAAASVLATQAFAADLGGNCCADLEERVSELEATTARKGNRKVSLEVSGHINESVMFWDDGRESNVYVGSNNTGPASRFRLVGSAKIDARWSTGYLLEFGVFDGSRGDRSNQASDDSNSLFAPIQMRHSAWWIDNKDLGRLWIGQTDTASAGITVINLANTAVAGAWAKQGLIGNGFRLRTGANNVVPGLGFGPGTSAVTIGNIRNHAHGDPGTSDRYNVVKYVSPTLHGFIFSAAWGEDDMWDVSLKYANEWNGVRVAFGLGYGQWTDGNQNPADPSSVFNATLANSVGDNLAGCANLRVNALSATRVNANRDVDCEFWAMSGAVMHVPTGLFLHGAYGQTTDHNRRFTVTAADAAITNATDEFWYLQGGIERNWFGIGKTSLYGEYHQATGGAVNATQVGANTGGVRVIGAADAINSTGAAAAIVSTGVNTWGLGVVQSVDAAALDLYMAYRHMDFDVKLSTGNGVAQRSNPINDFSYLIMGAQIKF